MKKTVASMLVFMLVLLGMSGIVGTGKAAMRDDVIAPYYSYTVKVTSGLAIEENGSAVCKGSIRVRSNDSSVSIVVQLQKKNGTTWTAVKTWHGNSDGGKYLISISNKYTVSAGTYRVYVDGLVTDVNGNSEAVSAISATKTYP